MGRSSRYRSRNSENPNDSDKKTFIPPGAPYLTKVNGRLVFARQKTPKTADIAIDLLGEAFGSRTRIIRNRSRSLECTTKSPLLITGSQYVPQAQLKYSPMAPQQAFLQPGTATPMLQYPYPSPNPQIPSPNMISTPQFQLQYPAQNPQLVPQQCTHCSHSVPQKPAHHSPPAPKFYTAPPSEPTEEDFEVLKQINAHFNEVNAKNKPKRLSTGSAADTIVQAQSTKAGNIGLGINTSKTTITVSKHVCANCGRLRSKKYHLEHPIKAGETPDAAFCRKCQKDASSTSGSGEDYGAKKKGKKENIEEDEPSKEPKIPFSKAATNSKRNKKEKKQSPSDEYVVVEEEEPEEDRENCTRLRIVESEVEKHPPLPQTVNENWKPESRHSEKNHQKPTARSRRPSFSSFEENLYANAAATQPASNDHFSVPQQEIRGRENNFETTSSLHSGSRQRRRVKRERPDTVPAAPWDAPHDIHPRFSDEAVVVTERWVYRPKKHMEEQRRQQEFVGKANYDEEAVREAEEAAKYYYESWTRDEQTSIREERPFGVSRRGRYRRDESLVPEYADSENSEYFIAENAVFHDIPHRTLTPSPPPEIWPEILRRQRSFDEGSNDSSKYGQSAGQAKAPRRKSPDQSLRSSRQNDRSTSTTASNRDKRRPWSRETPQRGWDEAQVPLPQQSPQRTSSYAESYSYEKRCDRLVTEQAVIVSPSKIRHSEAYHEDGESSNMTERERMAERDTKRVTFRSPSPSMASVRSGYDRSGYKSDSTDSFLLRKTSWDASDLRGPVLRPSNW